MNKLEEIRELIINFIFEKQQMEHDITAIENKRVQLAQKRNEIKLNIDYNNAYAKEVEANVNELGKQITDLGNQSQEIQNKLNSKFISLKNDVNMQIDNFITEGIRKIRKIAEIKQELEEKVSSIESKNLKYEKQKQEFFARFGRTLELSANAYLVTEKQKEKMDEYNQQISEIDAQIDVEQEELSELMKNKLEFKCGNYSYIIGEEIDYKQEIEQYDNEEDMSEDRLEEIVNLVENILEEQKKSEETIQEIEETEEESIILPFFIEEKVQESNEPVAEVELQMEDFQPVEEIEIGEIADILDLKIEEAEPIPEMKVEEIEQIPEVEIEEFATVPDVKIEEFASIPEMTVEEFEPEEKYSDIENMIREAYGKAFGPIEIEEDKEEIITAEENDEEQEKVQFGQQKVTIINITAKVEDDEIVYKAQLSNNKTIKIYPIKENKYVLNDKESREEIKEILINYAISEYRTLDKKIIKKIDPTICEILSRFAKRDAASVNLISPID